MKHLVSSWWVAGLLAACGTPSPAADGPRSPKLPVPVAIQPASVRPLEVHRAPRRLAVILGTDERGGSSTLPLVTKRNQVNVDVLWVRAGKPAKGGLSPVTLAVEPGDREKVSVGIFEEYSGGLGSQSRSSVWIAAFRAAGMLGRDLTDFRFSAEVGGFVDGPSAGALYTAGYLAAMTNTPVDPLVTMTGTVNPDGTVGPVGGIPQKFRAAIASGKKRLGFPLGLRMAKDENTGKKVDLEALASSKGAVAVEIADVYDAFRLLTGKTMPRPMPITEKALEVPGSIAYRFEKARDFWTAQRAQHLRGLAISDPRLPKVVRTLLEASEREARASGRAAVAGAFASAYQRAVEAAAYALAAQDTWTVTQMAQLRKWTRVGNYLGSVLGRGETVVKGMESIGARHPDSIGGHLLLISGFQRSISAIGHGVWAAEAVPRLKGLLRNWAGNPKLDTTSARFSNEFATAVMPLFINSARSTVTSTVSLQAFDIQSSETIAYSCSEPAARKLAESYASAALANLRYFESILLKELGNKLGVNELRARLFLGRMEPDYVSATGATRIALGNLPMVTKLKDKWGEDSLPWSLQTLAGSVLSYFKSSLLISRWYSLGIQRDRVTGRATSVKHPKAFANMLNSAKRNAREHANAANIAVGHVPVQSKIAYQRAKTLERGNIDEKLRALENYWASSVYSQTAVAMATHVINSSKHGSRGR